MISILVDNQQLIKNPKLYAILLKKKYLQEVAQLLINIGATEETLYHYSLKQQEADSLNTDILYDGNIVGSIMIDKMIHENCSGHMIRSFQYGFVVGSYEL